MFRDHYCWCMGLEKEKSSKRVSKSCDSGVLKKVYPYICNLETLIARLQRRVDRFQGMLEHLAPGL